MPQLSNRTPLQAALVPHVDREGHNVMVALVKGTWSFGPGGRLTPDHGSVPLSYEDTPLESGEKNALRLCSDLCESKPQAEVLVVAPADEAVRRDLAGRKIGVALGSHRFAKATEGDQWPFGPLARTDKQRLQHAGTYNAAWQRRRMPLLPVDFDLRYHQSAPEDQRLSALPSGDEPLRLAGLHGLDGVPLALPGVAVLITGNVRKDYFSRLALLDTITVWADAPRLTLLWRLVIKPRQKIEEIGIVNVHTPLVQTARELYGLA